MTKTLQEGKRPYTSVGLQEVGSAVDNLTNICRMSDFRYGVNKGISIPDFPLPLRPNERSINFDTGNRQA